jgi:hypothetical protein
MIQGMQLGLCLHLPLGLILPYWNIFPAGERGRGRRKNMPCPYKYILDGPRDQTPHYPLWELLFIMRTSCALCNIFREHIQHLHYIYHDRCKQTDQNFYQLYFLFLPVQYYIGTICLVQIHAFVKDIIPLSLLVFLFSILKEGKLFVLHSNELFWVQFSLSRICSLELILSG